MSSETSSKDDQNPYRGRLSATHVQGSYRRLAADVQVRQASSGAAVGNAESITPLATTEGKVVSAPSRVEQMVSNFARIYHAIIVGTGLAGSFAAMGLSGRGHILVVEAEPRLNAARPYKLVHICTFMRR